MFDKRVSELIDVYGGLLTKKQFLAMDLYYNEDYSLNEIASHMGVSRQGIWENIKQANENLEKYERELKICETSQKNEATKALIKELLPKNSQNEKIIALLDSIE